MPEGRKINPMKNLKELDHYRLEDYNLAGDETCGAFIVPSIIDGLGLRIIASTGKGWDHVSVSRLDRCPLWVEMELIKRLFFRNNEVAMQLHVPPADYINCHPHCLHLWRPHDAEIPLPPKELV